MKNLIISISLVGTLTSINSYAVNPVFAALTGTLASCVGGALSQCARNQLQDKPTTENALKTASLSGGVSCAAHAVSLSINALPFPSAQIAANAVSTIALPCAIGIVATKGHKNRTITTKAELLQGVELEDFTEKKISYGSFENDNKTNNREKKETAINFGSFALINGMSGLDSAITNGAD